jgi:hypothetical protein
MVRAGTRTEQSRSAIGGAAHSPHQEAAPPPRNAARATLPLDAPEPPYEERSPDTLDMRALTREHDVRAFPLDARRVAQRRAAMGSPSRRADAQALAQLPWPSGASTCAGGLLFLLPVLARLGYPEWHAAADEWAPFNVARRVLALACAHLALPPEDAAWTLTAAAPAPQAPDTFCAPHRWAGMVADRSALRLTARNGVTRVMDGSGRLLLAACPARPLPCAHIDEFAPRPDGHATPPLAQAVPLAWLTAVRRWLRRRAGIGIVNLVRRPARITCTPTHVDVDFALGDAILSVRRAGLDLDPGWLPWFGRVVTFRYGNVD